MAKITLHQRALNSDDSERAIVTRVGPIEYGLAFD
jgi:hypothetical protein